MEGDDEMRDHKYHVSTSSKSEETGRGRREMALETTLRRVYYQILCECFYVSLTEKVYYLKETSRLLNLAYTEGV